MKKDFTKSDVSFVLPSRNNLKYLKWSYNSIRKNIGYEPFICMADDASTDGTWEWMNEIKDIDSKVKILQNPGPERIGHTILYDRIVDELVETDLFIISHADMYWLPESLDFMLKYIKPDLIVSATRIEPPLHPEGPEKVVKDFGVEPELFLEDEILPFVSSNLMVEHKDKTTKGVFAPWMIYKHKFQEIGGHDPLFAPQSKEDSDFWNRALLNGMDFLQTWESYVYHMTCRGSRRNTLDNATTIYEDSPEWVAQNLKSTRNFIRKWGHYVKHDKYSYPVISPKYNIECVMKNSSLNGVGNLEPWFDKIYIDNPFIIEQYIEHEQKNTKFNLNDRVIDGTLESVNGDIIVELDLQILTKDDYDYLINLPDIIKYNSVIGKFQLGNLLINIKALNELQDSLIFVP